MNWAGKSYFVQEPLSLSNHSQMYIYNDESKKKSSKICQQEANVLENKMDFMPTASIKVNEKLIMSVEVT